MQMWHCRSIPPWGRAEDRWSPLYQVMEEHPLVGFKYLQQAFISFRSLNLPVSDSKVSMRRNVRQKQPIRSPRAGTPAIAPDQNRHFDVLRWRSLGRIDGMLRQGRLSEQPCWVCTRTTVIVIRERRLPCGIFGPCWN
jgi:hypothetical protein